MAGLPLCVKTPKGIDEVERRTYRLPMRARQVLIMVDGKRDLETLATMFQGDALPGILQQLLDDGFIAPLRSLPAEPAPQPTPPAPPAPAHAGADDEQRYAMSRTFMLNTLNAFVGIAASSLLTRIESATTLDELRRLRKDWREAIGLSGDGRKRLAELETKLAEFLPGGAPPAPPAPPAIAVAPPRAPAPADDRERLAMARNFMLNTLNAFAGLAASSLITRVESAPTLDELRHQYHDWRDAIALDRDGRKRLPELESKLAPLLS